MKSTLSPLRNSPPAILPSLALSNDGPAPADQRSESTSDAVSNSGAPNRISLPGSKATQGLLQVEGQKVENQRKLALVKNGVRQCYSELITSPNILASYHKRMLIALIDALTKHEIDPLDPKVDPNRVLKSAIETASELTPKQLDSWDELLPKAKETFGIVYNEFNDIEILRDIPSAQRHRLIIESDQLADFEATQKQTGVDVKHPYAMFLFVTKGYAYGIAGGWKVAMSSLQEPLSIELWSRVHQACFSGNDAISSELFDKGLCNGLKEFDETLTQDGHDEIQEFIAANEKRFGLAIPEIERRSSDWAYGIELRRPALPDGTIKNFIGTWIKDHKKICTKVAAMDHLQEKEKTILVVIASLDFLQKTTRMHPYKDGNSRVFEQVGLSAMLARAGEPIALLAVPGRFPGVSLREAVWEIRSAQIETRQTLKQDDSGIIRRGVLETEFDPEDRSAHKKMAHYLAMYKEMSREVTRVG